ncbi:uncharacterized protein LOC131859164 [Cryptomeria japonica]|uniref:uncharacterized protein LOC131859164 n=1 Tax=Cryptomeria japonica TaxID=3369 RepID=UPI0027DAA66A|nr:uncharacterized protein LOC131859164 [Cryptomeria japonica]
MNENMIHLLREWRGPTSNPMVHQLWKQIPPHLCWSIWKERNNRIFRDKEATLENVFTCFLKLILENLSMAIVKKPPNPPSNWNWEIARWWNLPRSFAHIDNSKRLRRQNTFWSPPNPGSFRLNFDGVAKHGLAAGGGVIRNHSGALFAAYTRNLSGHSSNQVEALALVWGVRFTLSMGIRVMDIKGDSKLIVDVVKGRNKLN